MQSDSNNQPTKNLASKSHFRNPFLEKSINRRYINKLLSFIHRAVV